MVNDVLCDQCGGTLVPGDRFCAHCGADTSAAPTVPPGADAVVSRSAAADALLLEAVRRATVGEYDVAGEIGRGGMAIVYLAHDIALERKVAIKALRPALLLTEGMAERFKREARTAAKLNHPNIIPIYAVRESDDALFFVMQYVQGKPLDEIGRAGHRLPLPVVASLLWDVGRALEHAHGRGVFHRDVKPSNILVDTDGTAIVTDFGIAKRADVDGLTQTGAALGTPTYMSPEQCGGKPVTGAADQYSLGIVAYELLAGRAPFAGQTPIDLMYHHSSVPPPPLRDARPDCPAPVEAAVLRMLAKDPGERWPSVREAIEAFGAAPLSRGDPNLVYLRRLVTETERVTLPDVVTPLSPLSVPAATTKPAAITSPTPRSGRRWLLTAGVVAAGVIVFLWWWTDRIPAPALLEQVQTESMPATPVAPQRGRLTVGGLPEAATITVDGEPRSGNTFELDPGRHEIRVDARGYRPIVDSVTVVAGESMTFNFLRPVMRPQPPPSPPPPRPAILTIVIRPVSGNVFIDNVAFGNRRRVVDTLPAGTHRIRIVRRGFRDRDTTLTLQPGERRQVMIGMELAR